MEPALRWVIAFLGIRAFEAAGVVISAAFLRVLQGENVLDATRAGIFLLLAGYILYPYVVISLAAFVAASVIQFRIVSSVVAASAGAVLFAVVAASDPVVVPLATVPMICGVIAGAIAAFGFHPYYTFRRIGRR